MAAILISHRVTMGKILSADKLRNYKVYWNHNALEKFSIRWGYHVTEICLDDQLPVVMAAILNVKKIQKKSYKIETSIDWSETWHNNTSWYAEQNDVYMWLLW